MEDEELQKELATSLEKSFGDNELEDIMNEIESLEKEFSSEPAPDLALDKAVNNSLQDAIDAEVMNMNGEPEAEVVPIVEEAAAPLSEEASIEEAMVEMATEEVIESSPAAPAEEMIASGPIEEVVAVAEVPAEETIASGPIEEEVVAVAEVPAEEMIASGPIEEEVVAVAEVPAEEMIASGPIEEEVVAVAEVPAEEMIASGPIEEEVVAVAEVPAEETIASGPIEEEVVAVQEVPAEEPVVEEFVASEPVIEEVIVEEAVAEEEPAFSAAELAEIEESTDENNVVAISTAGNSSAGEIDFSATGSMDLNINFKVAGETASLKVEDGGLVVTMNGVKITINEESGCSVAMDGGINFSVPLDAANKAA